MSEVEGQDQETDFVVQGVCRSLSGHYETFYYATGAQGTGTMVICSISPR